MRVDKKQHSHLGLIIAIIISLIIIVSIFIAARFYLRKSIYKPTITYSSTVTSQQENISWPHYGQSAIATDDYGNIEDYGSKQQQPTASTAKIITALAILQEKPISVNSDIPNVVLGQSDVDLYTYYASHNGSNVKVVAGESITEYQALEAIMLPSSNNMADSMAIWAFGSLTNYQKYATKMLKSFGLSNTTIGIDACGFSATTKSTAHDLAIIGLKALNNPVLASIVKQQSAIIPVVGAINNVNQLLKDHNDIIGIKTGNTDEAGGVFVLGGVQDFDGHKQNIVTVVMGAADVSTAQNDAYSLFNSAEQNFKYQKIISTNQNMGYYSVPLSSDKYYIKTKSDYSMFVWSSTVPSIEFELKSIHINTNDDVGYVLVKLNQKLIKKIPVTAAGSIEYNNPLLNILFK
jgi:D-alanyl-D-alanine carboxypeptidase